MSEHVNIITGEIIGRAPGLVVVQPDDGSDPVLLDRFSAIPPLPDGKQRFKLDNTNTSSRPSPRRAQYRDYFSSLSKNARRELACANPGSLSDLVLAVGHLMQVVRSTLEFSEPAGHEYMVNNDQIDDLDQAYQHTIQTLNNIKTNGLY